MIYYPLLHYILISSTQLSPSNAKDREPYEGEIEAIECPGDGNWHYNYHGNHCLNFRDKKANLTEGLKFCNGFRGLSPNVGLITINQILATQFITDHYKGEVWTGLNDIAMENVFDGEVEQIQQTTTEATNTTSNTTDCDSLDNNTFPSNSCGGTEAFVVCEIPGVDLCRLPNNGGCSQYCLVDGYKKRKCACNAGFVQADETKCLGCALNNGDCEHFCYEVDKAKTCVCKTGYRLVNWTKCEDIDECKMNNGGCEHYCKNTMGSWECFCKQFYSRNGLWCIYNQTAADLANQTGNNIDNLVDQSVLPKTVMVVSGLITILIVTVGSFFVLVENETLVQLKSRRDRELLSIALWEEDQEKWDKEVHYDETEDRELSSSDFDDLPGTSV